jgi:hypothetical protein
MEATSQLHVPVALSREKEPQSPLDKMLTGLQSRNGCYGKD